METNVEELIVPNVLKFSYVFLPKFFNNFSNFEDETLDLNVSLYFFSNIKSN